MRKIVIAVALFIGLFGSSVYAEGPSIEKTQEYIAEIINNREKTGDDKYYAALEFTATCQGVYSQFLISNSGKERKKYVFFNLIEKHYFSWTDSVHKLWLESINMLYNIKIFDNKTTEVTWIFPNSAAVHGIYGKKLDKATKHLNTECQKLSTKKKELF